MPLSWFLGCGQSYIIGLALINQTFFGALTTFWRVNIPLVRASGRILPRRYNIAQLRLQFILKIQLEISGTLGASIALILYGNFIWVIAAFLAAFFAVSVIGSVQTATIPNFLNEFILTC